MAVENLLANHVSTADSSPDVPRSLGAMVPLCGIGLGMTFYAAASIPSAATSGAGRPPAIVAVLLAEAPLQVALLVEGNKQVD